MTLIIDPQNSGISGNMVVGALADFGVDSDVLINIMEHYGSYFGSIEVNITIWNDSDRNVLQYQFCKRQHLSEQNKLLFTML